MENDMAHCDAFEWVVVLLCNQNYMTYIDHKET